MRCLLEIYRLTEMFLKLPKHMFDKIFVKTALTCKYALFSESNVSQIKFELTDINKLFDFSLSVKAAPHECVIRTGQPQA